MSRTLLKDTFREIRKSLGRFIAILGIVMIGVAFFAGVTASSYDMKYTADKYYDDYHMTDYRILSTLGLTEEDIEAIAEIEGLENVSPGYSMDILTTRETTQMEAAIYSFNEDNKLNQLVLEEGRFPENENECVARYEKMRDGNIKIGDQLVFTTGTEADILNSLSTDTYEVVGLVSSPYYLSYELGSTSIGDGSLDIIFYIPEENFLSDTYTVAYAAVEGALQENSYEDEYWELVDPVTERIEELSEERIKLRLEELEETYGTFMEVPSEGSWYVLDRNSFYSYVDYGNCADRMGAIAKVFPVFFYLVAALVCLTTMTRMIDEQRGNIGTLKALGYGKASIAMKYVIYALLASVIGGMIGAAAGMYIFPKVIFDSWSIMYSMPEISFMPQPLLVVVSILVAVGVTIAATIGACYTELVETPALLMRPKAPKNGKKILLERIGFLWKHMSFTYKVTFRNLFRYKKRFLMTIIGISGCTALLIAGFGIKDSISQVVDRQFDAIFKYDMTVAFQTGADEALSEITADNRIEDAAVIYADSYIVNKDNRRDDAWENTVTLMAVSDENHLSGFVGLISARTGKECLLPEEGVLLSEKLAKDYGIEAGDTLYIADDNDKMISMKIADVIEMYVEHYVFMSETYYEQLFGAMPENNMILANINDNYIEEENDIGYDIINDLGADTVTYYTGIKSRFEDMISTLDLVTIVLIVSAGALAFVVLYNLINVNISERLREIATIKVLGFYDKEVASYVYRENILLTIVGAGFGLGLGVILHHFIMEVVEMDNIMFGRNVELSSYLLSFGITLAFGIFVNLVMFGRLKKIPMVESLKSVE